LNIVEILGQWSHTRGNHDALVGDVGARARMTFGELEDATARRASMLVAAGLRAGSGKQPGDCVLIMVPASADLYVALLAVLRANMTAMFVDPSAGRAAIDDACHRVPPRGFIGVPRAFALRVLCGGVRRIPVAFTTGAMGWRAHRWSRGRDFDPRPMEPCDDGMPALITFTSGSTSAPKAAVRTHGLLLAQHAALAGALALKPDDVVATTFPVFVLSHLASGVCTKMMNAVARENADLVRELAGVTVLEAAPAFCTRLAAQCRRDGVRLPALRRIVTGGGPVFPSLLDALHEIAPNATVVALYGSTEAEPIAHADGSEITPDDKRSMRAGKGLLAGTPVREAHVRVMQNRWGDPVQPLTQQQFDQACCRTGDAGEIVVSGLHVLPGYYHGVGDAETKFRVDDAIWHRTGDAGYLDARGRLWLLGRCSARIEDDRGTLYPLAVESVASDDPGVSRAALVAHDGMRVLLVETGSGAAGVVARLRERLAWAHLDRIVECRSIPMDRRHRSKVDYTVLARMLERGTFR
jgi:olefin beta-lactone synthetase